MHAASTTDSLSFFLVTTAWLKLELETSSTDAHQNEISSATSKRSSSGDVLTSPSFGGKGDNLLSGKTAFESYGPLTGFTIWVGNIYTG